ncbi:hypothetical protein P4O66_014810, partial [Electrophorus voltai]
PCPPDRIQTIIGCRNNSASVSWSPAIGAVSYVATLQSSNGSMYTCNGIATSCDVTNLPCGQNYSVTVAVNGQNCNSTPSVGSPVATAPCVPQNVSANINCGSNVAAVTWQSSQGAFLYLVKANSSNGQTANCTSSTNSCNLSLPVSCGVTYTITVMASNNNCSSACSTPVQLQSAPCPPDTIQTIIGCRNNSASVSWSPAIGAVSYVATLQSSNGSMYTCNGIATSCDVTNLPCGQNYSVTVAVNGQNCNSTPSVGSPVATAPCVPQNVSANINCGSNVAAVTWQSSQGAFLYLVKANSSNGQTANCTSSTNSCNLSLPVSCGVTYTITVMASNNNCSSACSTPVQLQSAPCPPDTIQTIIGCRNNSASVSWSPAIGAVSYVATLQSSNGSMYTCNGIATSCDVTNLPCGQNYSVTVAVNGQNCNSTPSVGSPVATAPCVPQNVSANFNCGSNVAAVTWQSSQGAFLYLVKANSSNGQTANCTSSTNSCNLSLPVSCGVTYTITVMASNNNCSSACSTPVQLQSAPCPPDRIQTIIGCRNNSASVSWSPAIGAVSYVATLQSSNGSMYTCNGIATSCDVTNLPCGQNYSVTVAVNGQNCNSTPSVGSPVATAPCVPQNVSANINCGSNVAAVTWQSSQGAFLYLVKANSSNGQTANCTSSTNSCNLSLPVSCGVTYTITVMASNNNCSSACSTPVQLQSGPCQPLNVSVNIPCGNSIAMLSWVAQAGAVKYSATAQSDNATALYCQSTDTSCFLDGLQCGAVYNFTVLASGQTCNSSNSNALTAGR